MCQLVIKCTFTVHPHWSLVTESFSLSTCRCSSTSSKIPEVMINTEVWIPAEYQYQDWLETGCVANIGPISEHGRCVECACINGKLCYWPIQRNNLIEGSSSVCLRLILVTENKLFYIHTVPNGYSPAQKVCNRRRHQSRQKMTSKCRRLATDGTWCSAASHWAALGVWRLATRCLQLFTTDLFN